MLGTVCCVLQGSNAGTVCCVLQGSNAGDCVCCVLQGSNAGDCVVYYRVVMLGTVLCITG